MTQAVPRALTLVSVLLATAASAGAESIAAPYTTDMLATATGVEATAAKAQWAPTSSSLFTARLSRNCGASAGASWANFAAARATAAGQGELGFTGHQYDVESGLVYARARYYDPELGRFISRDSYGGTENDVPSLHRYAYARENPYLSLPKTPNAT